MKCPNCNYEIEGEYFTCERSCDFTEVWWCDNCGAIALAYNGDVEEENFNIPIKEK